MSCIVFIVISDVMEPRLRNLNSSMCHKSHCPQGCDENTGQCICKKGYRLDAQNKCQGQYKYQDQKKMSSSELGDFIALQVFCSANQVMYQPTCTLLVQALKIALIFQKGNY